MDKTNRIYIIIIVVCVLLVVGFCAFLIINHKEDKITDAEKFKKEYELYNGIKDGNGKKLKKVNISSNNPIIYKTGKEILDVIDKEDAIIFFGYPTEVNCRNVIETILKVAKEKQIKKIYYVDIFDIRDEYEYDGTLVPKQTKKGTDAYYKLLEFFGSKLERYYVPDKNGNMYSTDVTRLESSTIISVNNGKILDMHVGTLDKHTDVYQKLTKDEIEKLADIYSVLFDSLKKENE